jgi:hypothetical protein
MDMTVLRKGGRGGGKAEASGLGADILAGSRAVG